MIDQLQILGNWCLEVDIPVAGALLHIDGEFAFADDGVAKFEEHFALRLGERVLSSRTKSTVGHWTISAGKLIAEMPGHVGSPFTFTMTKAGDLQWYNGKTWRRHPTKR